MAKKISYKMTSASGISIIDSRMVETDSSSIKSIEEVINEGSKKDIPMGLKSSSFCSQLCDALGYAGKEKNFMEMVGYENQIKTNTLFSITKGKDDVNSNNIFNDGANIKRNIKSARVRVKSLRIKQKELNNESSIQRPKSSI